MAGQVTGFTVGNGLVEQYTYSSDRLQITNQKVLSGATALMDFTYNYSGAAGDHGAGTTAGNAGQLVSTTGTLNGASRNQTFQYDDLGRLEKATGSDAAGAWQRRFAYDRWGNRTQVWNATTGGTQTQQVNLALIGSAPSNRVSSYWDTAATGGATKTVSYDAAGNTTNDGTYSFTYDAENRIVQVNAVATGARVASYTYDSANRRIKKTVGSTTTCYIWEGAQVIAEYNNTASPVSPNTEYIFTGGRMLAEERTGSGTTRFFHQDRLSTRLTTNSAGTVLGTQSHLPFGEALSESSEQQKWKFTTYERDSETGDDYAINRGYWPTLGRFRQADPVTRYLGSPQRFNRYTYVLSNPTNSIDPLGLDCIPLGDGTFDCTSDPPIVRLEGTGHNSGFSGFGSSPCTEIYIDGFYAGSTCGGLQPFVDGGGDTQNSGQEQDTRTDCQKFADIVEQIVNETIGTRRDTPGLDVQMFMDRLATTFTEFTAARLGAVTGAPGEGVNRNYLTFGSGGFAQQFFERGGNQVRHAVGGLIAGYVGIPLHDPVFGLGMNDRENPNDLVHGVPDINLNNKTVPYGASIATISTGPSLIGSGTIGGAEAIKRLPNWIRNTLCAH